MLKYKVKKKVSEQKLNDSRTDVEKVSIYTLNARNSYQMTLYRTRGCPFTHMLIDRRGKEMQREATVLLYFQNSALRSLRVRTLSSTSFQVRDGDEFYL